MVHDHTCHCDFAGQTRLAHLRSLNAPSGSPIRHCNRGLLSTLVSAGYKIPGPLQSSVVFFMSAKTPRVGEPQTDPWTCSLGVLIMG